MASSSGYLSDLGRKKRACEDDIAALEQQLKEVERKIAEERARQGFDEVGLGSTVRLWLGVVFQQLIFYRAFVAGRGDDPRYC